MLNVDNGNCFGDDGVAVPLSTGEFDLLLALVERPQRVLSRDQLLDLARGRAANTFDRSMDTQVSRLRKKLSATRAIRKSSRPYGAAATCSPPTVSQE